MKKAFPFVGILLATLLLLTGCSGNLMGRLLSSFSKTSALVPEDFCDGYELAEFEKYNSPAKENGLADTKIWVEGTFEDCRLLDNGSSIIATLTMRDGNQWMLLLWDTSLGNRMEDFSTLEGEEVVACGQYMGYSELLQMPAIHLDQLCGLSTGEIHTGMGALVAE